MDVEHRLKALEMNFLHISERLTNVEEFVKSHIFYSSLGPTNYLISNNAQQPKSTNRITVEEFSLISKRLAKVEKQLQSKREHASTNVGRENNNGHFPPHGIVPLSLKKSTFMGQSDKPGPLMNLMRPHVPCNEPTPLMDFTPSLISNQSLIMTPNFNGALFKRFREILNKLNLGNFDKLSAEFLSSIGSVNDFAELVRFIFSKAISELDSPALPTLYAQLMAKVESSNNSNATNLLTELRKASMDHFSELFESKEVLSSDTQVSEIATVQRRTKGILRFITELFKVNIVPLSDMKSFVDCLLLHPQETNLNHVCLMLKWTGSLFGMQSNPTENGAEFSSTMNERVNSNHIQMAKWFVDVCTKLERKKDHCSNRTKFAIMDILEMRDKKWNVMEPLIAYAENFVKPLKGNSGSSWRDTQHSVEQGRTTAQQYTLFPVSSESDNVQNLMLNSSLPMAYNQVVRKSINVTTDSLDLRASSPSTNSGISQIQIRDTLKMQPLSQSQLSLVRSGNSRSPSVTASLDEGTSTRARNRRRNRPSKKLRDKNTDLEASGNSIMPTTTNNGFSVIRNSVNLINADQTPEGLLGKPIEEILNAYGTQMGTKKSQRYTWVQCRFSGHPSSVENVTSLVGEICRAAMHWTDKKKIAIAGSFLEALYFSNCISIDRIIDNFRTVVTVELKRSTGCWPGTSRIAANANIMANIGSLLAETFVKEKDLNWLISLKPTKAGEVTDHEQEEVFRLISEKVKTAIVASRGLGTYTKLSSKTALSTRDTKTYGEDPSVIQNCATWNM